MRERFSDGKVEEKTFKYIGFKVKQFENKIILDHSEYIEKMENEILDPKKASAKDEPLNTQEQTNRKLIGQLNWVVQRSRLDMPFEMIKMSTKMKITWLELSRKQVD